ncbi:MAG: hypothetical protein CVU90_12475 [Firmicutes bacterium HGW-Firmicutes-15]|nr:MAG: hypothetical protein CVU90_12475 [Firmicutes bacterium HGW-Firmicutes-15]
MNCHDIKQNMYNYCDGLVSPDLRSTMAAHLNECESCRNNYQLTLIEKEALSDAGDIPLLSEAFTARIMGSLISADSVSSMPQPLVMSKSSSPYFKRTSWYSGLAVIAAVIALCLYLPNLKNISNNINVADNSSKQQQLELQSNAVKNNDYGTLAKDEDTIKLSQVSPPQNAGSGQSKLPSITLESESRSVQVDKDLTYSPSVLSTPFSSEAMKRSTSLDVGRSIRIESQVNETAQVTNTAALSFSPQNIPTRFKLMKLDTASENEAVYNYASQDGKENFQLHVAPYHEKMMAIGPTSNITFQDSPPSLTRDIQVGDQKITLTVSGNIPTEELIRLVNTIQFK